MTVHQWSAFVGLLVSTIPSQSRVKAVLSNIIKIFYYFTVYSNSLDKLKQFLRLMSTLKTICPITEIKLIVFDFFFLVHFSITFTAWENAMRHTLSLSPWAPFFLLFWSLLLSVQYEYIYHFILYVIDIKAQKISLHFIINY